MPSGTLIVWSLIVAADGRAVDPRRLEADAAEPGGDRVELDPIDRGAGRVPDRRARVDVDRAGRPGELQDGVVGGFQVDAGGGPGGRSGGREEQRHDGEGHGGRDDGRTGHAGHATPASPSRAAPYTWPVTETVAIGDPFLQAIGARLPGLRLLTDPLDRESYRFDETAYLTPGLPGAVALPTETAQVSELLRLASEFRVPVVPRGAGSGLSGGATGIEGALTIAFTAMDKILEIDKANLVAVVQPGVINAHLKAAVAAEGLFYPPDPASYEMCSIGGNLGTNAGGLCCVKYGQTRESVLSLEVVMADGTVIRTGGRNIKDVAGYSLTHLIVGSQGTLAVITEATLRLRPAPPPRSTLLAFFPSLESAGRRGGRDRRGRPVAR